MQFSHTLFELMNVPVGQELVQVFPNASTYPIEHLEQSAPVVQLSQFAIQEVQYPVTESG